MGLTVGETCGDFLLSSRRLLDKPAFPGVDTTSAQTVAMVESRLLVTFGLFVFAATIASCRVFVLLRDQQSAQGVQIAAQMSQLKVSFKTDFRTVTTTLHCIAALQRADRRFHARMILLSGKKYFVRFRLLNDGLLHAFLRRDAIDLTVELLPPLQQVSVLSPAAADWSKLVASLAPRRLNVENPFCVGSYTSNTNLQLNFVELFSIFDQLLPALRFQARH